MFFNGLDDESVDEFGSTRTERSVLRSIESALDVGCLLFAGVFISVAAIVLVVGIGLCLVSAASVVVEFAVWWPVAAVVINLMVYAMTLAVIRNVFG